MFANSDIMDMGNAHECILGCCKELPPIWDDEEPYTMLAEENFDE